MKWTCRGSSSELQIRVPPLEDDSEFLIQGFHPPLYQQMRAALGPLHLLLLTEAFADDLFDRRFDKAGSDALPIPIALASSWG